ncbi:LUD domain-containing protein [Halobaculum sp. MBLA0147]|uniref:LUD domain-containing protein n=1 Tax=Halobaculum sp. MBLA0147 TaxID=3079934 RepID=UPI003524F1F8
MSTTHVETFTAELDALGVEWSETTPEEVGDVLAAAADPPVVAAPSDHECVSPETLPIPVETEPTLETLRDAHTGITDATLGIVPYGSVVLRTDTDDLTEAASLFVDHHVVVLAERDLRPDVASALAELGPLLRAEEASAVVATGPSATADMGALVQGAHGPEAVHVVLLREGDG